MRTFRFLTLAVAVALPLFAAANAAAGSGKAIIPPSRYYYSSSSSKCGLYLYFTNISDSPIEITLTLRYHDGSILYESSSDAATGDVRAGLFSSYTEATTSGDGYTAKFELGAKQTGAVQFNPYSTAGEKYMFGTIAWENAESTDDAHVALVTTAMNFRHLVEAGRARESKLFLPVNNGMPF